MTRDEIVKDLKKKTASYKTGDYKGFLAVQVTLTDQNEVFYVEIKDGKLAIEPYEYNDRQANLKITADNFVKMINGELDGVKAFLTGKLKIDGDISKAQEMAGLFKG
ncbi:MAG: SCP2 sterol-binding domain-containing protein [Lachnospiraceae bacterium]|jgi:putative sterol carrier protein|nr:SCP2 sterol-binding domain-containing protein [Lachnospiraceae bacterium]